MWVIKNGKWWQNYSFYFFLISHHALSQLDVLAFSDAMQYAQAKSLTFSIICDYT